MKLRALKAAFPHTTPVLTGYIFMGMAFGILLSSKGYNVWWAILMSVTILAGSMQFVAIEILSSPFNLIGAIILTLTVNARHLFYGLSMLKKFKDMGRLRPYMIFSLTDETYSLLCSTIPPKNVDEKWFYFFIALLDHSYWVIGSAIGAAASSILKFNTKGIDFVMTALFIVIFVEQWENSENHISSLVGLFVTLVCLICFGSENFIIFSMLGIFVILTLLRKHLEEKKNDLNYN